MPHPHIAQLRDELEAEWDRTGDTAIARKWAISRGFTHAMATGKIPIEVVRRLELASLTEARGWVDQAVAAGLRLMGEVPEWIVKNVDLGEDAPDFIPSFADRARERIQEAGGGFTVVGDWRGLRVGQFDAGRTVDATKQAVLEAFPGVKNLTVLPGHQEHVFTSVVETEAQETPLQRRVRLQTGEEAFRGGPQFPAVEMSEEDEQALVQRLDPTHTPLGRHQQLAAAQQIATEFKAGDRVELKPPEGRGTVERYDPISGVIMVKLDSDGIIVRAKATDVVARSAPRVPPEDIRRRFGGARA